ncbi:MAG TPA: hypothetical protein VME69_12060 [Methylocella sp.]|nr:hypothetical protein [Methylocella sp.]
MSNGAIRSRRDRCFWLPVRIFFTVVVGIVLFLVVTSFEHLITSERESAALAVAAMRSPAEAMENAEAWLLDEQHPDERIDFSLYRDLLLAALAHQDSEVRNAANQSIARVLHSNLACANDLKKELASMPTQVFIMTSDADASAGRDIAQKLKRREGVIVTQETLDPEKISKTEVLCYDHDADNCKQTAQSVINLLQEEGFEVSGPTQKDPGATLFKKRIEVILAVKMKSETATLSPLQKTKGKASKKKSSKKK